MKKLIFLIGLFVSVSTFANEGEQEERSAVSEIKGLVDGYNVRNRDDKVNFGLVMPVMTKSDILNFQISTVISPKIDVISAIGQEIPIPSNISIPRQKERYSFFSITLDKPFYTLPTDVNNNPKNVGVLEGIFPFTKVVDAFRADQPLFSLVNDFNFNSFSLANVSEAPSTNDVNMTVGSFSIEEEVEFSLNQDIPRGFIALGMTLNNLEGDEEAVSTYFPTELKTLKSNRSLNLKSTEDSTPIIVLIPKEAFDSLENSSKSPLPFSLAWNTSTTEQILPILSDKVTLSNTELLIDTDEINDSFKILGYKATILKQSENGEENLDESSLEVVGFGDLPQSINVEGHLETEARVRLDVFAVEKDAETSASTLEEIAREAKLVSRYEVDFK